MLRRDFLRAGLAAGAVAAFPFSRSLADDSAMKVLYFTNSAGFEHEPVKIVKDGLSVSDIALKKLGAAYNIEVVCTKDGKIFDGDLKQFSAIAFYTSGDLLTGPNAMSAEGKKRFLAAIDDGIGFLGFHASTDTWRTEGPAFENQTKVDPYISMLGAEFISHGPDQEAVMKVTQPTRVPWLKDKGEAFKHFEEWYALKNFNKDMHVILTLETEGMQGRDYNRPPFPVHWARMQKKGRVMYTALGHHNAFFENENMMRYVRDSFAWILGEYDMDLTPNIDQVAPGASILQR